MPDVGLIGRADELERARGVLRRALDGTHGVLLVGGEAGVGRSRLVAAVSDEAAGLGFRTAAGACVRMDAGALTYAAIVACLRALAAGLDPGDLAASLGAWRHEVARLVPEVTRAAPEPAHPADDPLARLRLFEALTGWLNRLADRVPLLLAVEDLHWADAATLDLVRTLADGLAGRSVLVVTLRTDEALAPAVQATVAELVRDGAERLELAPFTRDEVGALVAAAVPGAEPDPEAIDALLERSGGNAFLARELIDAGLLDPGATADLVPRSLRDILGARLAALDEPVLDALRAAALHPGPIDDELLAAVLDRPVRAVGAELREALDAGVLVTRHGSPRFRHALQREVLRETLGPGERRALHGAYADALGAGTDPSRATAAAWHRDASGDAPGALRAHVAAAGIALAASAFDAAARHAARAAELRDEVPPLAADGLPDAAFLLEQASIATLLAGDPGGSAALARRALAAVGDDGPRAAALHDRVRWALWEGGDRAGAARELEAAVARLGDHPAPALRARLLAEQAAMRMDAADEGPALALSGEAIELARAAGPATPGAREAEALALGVRGRTLAVHGRLDEGLASLRAGMAIAEELGNLQGRATGVATIATLLARWGRSREALADIDAGVAAADASGLARSLGARLVALAARACLGIGDWDEAARRLADGLARRPARGIEAALRVVGLRLAAGRGHAAEAAAHEARLAALAGALGDPDDAASVRVAFAEAALASGRPAVVRELFDAELADLAAGLEPGASAAMLASLAAGAEADLAVDARARGDADGAVEAARRLEGIVAIVRREAGGSTRRGGPLAEALLAHVAAEAARLDPDTDRRVAAWVHAVRAWDAIDRPYAAARARHRLAEARLANGEARPAVAGPLLEARAVADRLGAAPLLAAIDRLARLARVDVRTGTAAPGTEPAGATDPLATLGLTPREREILRLVAAGWSNARIADELGISASTASVHVSNILAKLDVQNRVEAAALAHRLGVVGAEPR